MEQRKSTRQRTFLRGVLRLGDQNYSMSCIVRDISETGAKLRFKSPKQFSGNVELHIPEKQKTIQATVVWVDHCEVGISFSAPVTIAEPAPVQAASADAAVLERMARLEAEIAALKQMLGRMQGGGDSKVKVA